jgi:potassium efflux system protein
MYNLFLPLLRFCIIGLLTFSSLSYGAAPEKSAGVDAGAEVQLDIIDELSRQQKRLDAIKQEVSAADGDSRLGALNDGAQTLADNADALIATLTKQQSQLETQLAVLGPAPEAGAETETAEVTQKRDDLTLQKKTLDDQITQAAKIKEQSINLSEQIVAMRRNALKTQLALNSGSILKPSFWAPLIQPQKEDVNRLSALVGQFSTMFRTAWDSEWIVGTLFLLGLALALATLGYRLLNRSLSWIGIRLIPAGHLRRSFLAAATVTIIVLVNSGVINLVVEAFTRVTIMTPEVATLSESLVMLTVFCALLAGLGSAFLSTDRPSWRLPAINDKVTDALKIFPAVTGLSIFVFGLIDLTNAAIATSLPTSIAANGLTSLLIAVLACIISLRGSRTRRRLAAEGEKIDSRSTLAGLIHVAILLTAVAIIFSLATGYIALARFLTYELLWTGIVLSCLYLLMNLLVDASDAIFSPDYASGKRIKSSLNLDDRHLALANSLTSALGRVTLIMFAALALLNGTFGTTTPLELLHNATEIWGGKGLEQLNIVPARMLNAVILLALSLYLLRTVRRWLESDFLPKTTLDRGIQASLVTLITNIGYVVVISATLSALGVKWSNLAWIVSALSVGIGFGLQEIVKNFISGIILLTERPVKVGDLVSISGIEGDIRRINVRATEIQLSDRSTVIVPNSQFISQNVRNVTMGDAQGVVTIELKLALDINPELVRDILLDTYRENEAVLEAPAPSVTFKRIDPDGIVLSVTGYVRSPRIVSATRSDLLYEILKRLHDSEARLADSSIVKFKTEAPPEVLASDS